MKAKKETSKHEEDYQGNFIAVGSEVVVHSQTSSLKKVEETINRLINKHKELIIFKRQSKIATAGVG